MSQHQPRPVLAAGVVGPDLLSEAYGRPEMIRSDKRTGVHRCGRAGLAGGSGNRRGVHRFSRPASELPRRTVQRHDACGAPRRSLVLASTRGSGPGASPGAEERWPEVLLLGEMIGATEQAQSLVAKMDLEALEGDRLRRDASLWNFTVIGEASTQLDDHFQRRFSS